MLAAVICLDALHWFAHLCAPESPATCSVDIHTCMGTMTILRSNEQALVVLWAHDYRMPTTPGHQGH